MNEEKITKEEVTQVYRELLGTGRTPYQNRFYEKQYIKSIVRNG
jgi:hypothetical protein